MKYIGIDLHATNSVVAIVDAQEQVLYCKRHANRLQDIVALLRCIKIRGVWSRWNRPTTGIG